MSDTGALALLATLGILAKQQEAARNQAAKAKQARRQKEESEAREREAQAFKQALAHVVAFSGLYQAIEIPVHLRDSWFAMLPAKVESWCGTCNTTRPYNRLPDTQPALLQYQCLGCEQGRFECVLKVVDTNVIKIGQYPALADALASELERYKALLPKAQWSDLRRAIGLRSHGIGAGSYVYLRRILEWLLGEAEKKASAAGTAPSTVGKRVGERIKAMKGFLPDALVNNTKL